MDISLRRAVESLRREGRFGLVELLLQAEEVDAEHISLYRAFQAQQEADAPALLAGYYRSRGERLDGSDLTELLALYRLVSKAAHVAFPPYENDDFCERLARLIYALAGVDGWRLLPDEIGLFPEDEQELLRILRERQREIECAPFSASSSLPLVSILIPTYHMPHIFMHTMRSAAIQDYPNLEIIVIDNSTDEETARLMGRYASDARVRYIRNADAKTKEDNFARFAEEARGEYLQWLMHDDILRPGKIAKMAEVLLHAPGISLVMSERAFIDAHGMRMDSSLLAASFPVEGASAAYSGRAAARQMVLGCRNIVGEPSAVLFRRNDLQHHYWRAEVRGYRTISDVAMWLELLSHGDLFVFKEPLSCYRRHGAQEGQSPDVLILSRLEWIRLIREERKRGILLTHEDDGNIAKTFLQDVEAVAYARESASAELRDAYDAVISAFRAGDMRVLE